MWALGQAGFYDLSQGLRGKTTHKQRHPAEGIMSENVISLIVLNPNVHAAGLLKRHMSTVMSLNL